LLPEPGPRAPGLDAAAVETIRQQGAEKVADYARAWAASERFDRNVLVFADLLKAVGEPVAALDLVQRLYETRPADERRSGHFGLVIDALANAYSQASRFDKAIALFTEALDIYNPTTAEEQHLRRAEQPCARLRQARPDD